MYSNLEIITQIYTIRKGVNSKYGRISVKIWAYFSIDMLSTYKSVSKRIFNYKYVDVFTRTYVSYVFIKYKNAFL